MEGGRRLRKAFVLISSKGFASRLQQVFLLAAGFQCGYISFREQVRVLCGGFVSWFEAFFVNSWICVKSFVNTICRHCQRTFGSSKDILWRGDTTSIKVAAQVPGWVSLQHFFTVASGVPCLLSVPLSARLLSWALQEMSNNQVFRLLVSAPELALERGSEAPVWLAPGWCSLLGLRWLGLL